MIDQKRNKNDAGSAARDMLIEVGLDLFGQHGYNSVSVRQICKEANMNIASINYHFGGKAELYMAVADHIVERLNGHIEPAATEIQAYISSGRRNKTEVLELMIKLVDIMADILIPDSVEAEKWARFITRFQLGDDVPEHGLSKHEVADVMSHLIGVVRDRPHDLRENAILAQSIFGQVLVFRVSRASSKNALGISKLGQKETNEIKQILRRNIRAIFSEDVQR